MLLCSGFLWYLGFLTVKDHMAVSSKPFGRSFFGEPVELYTIDNSCGLRVEIMSYGGIIRTLQVPDRLGRLADIVLGMDSAIEYTDKIPYFGCIAGRFANRIRHGLFSIDGEQFKLAVNNGPNALHGGIRGFDKVIWTGKPDPAGNSIQLNYLSPAGEEGYPGTLQASVLYELTDENELRITYGAVTDQPTPCNVTNHSYFNLAGHQAGSIESHILMLKASTFLPVDSTSIPLGQPAPVKGTPLDFSTPVKIGERIDYDYQQLRFAGGYDHNFCIDGYDGDQLLLAARVEEPSSGRIMEVLTTEPGVQFYTGNFLDGSIRGKDGAVYQKRSGFCLETQHYPDSPNQAGFPDTILRPGRKFKSATVYRFLAE